MAIAIRVVEKYDDAVFKDLVARNLESIGSFVSAWEFYADKDPDYKLHGTTIRVGAFDGDRLVGLSWGKAQKENRFMMHMSLVEADYRHQGLYSQMLEKILSLTKGRFDEVDSYHHQLNNLIIAAKLRRGFQIVGLDTCLMIGPRVHLRYYHNQKLLDMLRFRAGLLPRPPSDESP